MLDNTSTCSAKIAVIGKSFSDLHFYTPFNSRFLEYAPNETMAKLLKGENLELSNEETLSSQDYHGGYIIPDYRMETVDKSIRENLS